MPENETSVNGKRRTVLIPRVAVSAFSAADPVTLPCPPWEQPGVSLAGQRPETEPKRFWVISRPARRNPLMDALREALE